jgi:glutamyl-tRNA synthetase
LADKVIPSEALQLEARKVTLLNAIKHGGKAETGAVIGRLLGAHPELRQKAAEVRVLVAGVLDQVNEMSLADQEKIVQENWPEELAKEKLKTERALPPLPNVDKYPKIITRFSPNPDSVLHLGNARAVILSHDYARKYNGEFILRFEDTDPRLKKAALEFYELIRTDIRWLECNWDEEYYQSDRLELYYRYAQELILKGDAYVCECPSEDFKHLVESGEACPCRTVTPEENMARWKAMLEGEYEEGEAVLRVKTELDHPNPAVRDWPALRVIDSVKYPHPRVGSKYRVWPLYNMACGVDDHLMGISHVIRGKEHLTNMERQKYLYKHLGWTYPDAIHYGRLHLVGMDLSKSKMMRALEEGVYSDLSDPRLGTLMALRRRGITPQAIRSVVYEVGPRPVDATISWDNVYAANRKIIDRVARRFFFVDKPIVVTISDVKGSRTVKIPAHPEHPEIGTRELAIAVEDGKCRLLLSKADLPILKPRAVVRLMELFNFKVNQVASESVTAEFHSETYAEARKVNAPLVHWLPDGLNCRATVVMPTAERIDGLGEHDLTTCRVDEVIQLVRFGFGRVDKVAPDSVVIYFAHQ